MTIEEMQAIAKEHKTYIAKKLLEAIEKKRKRGK